MHNTQNTNGSYPKLKMSETRRNYYKRLAVAIYDRMYKIRTNGKVFCPPSMITEMKTYGTGKWITPFSKVCRFLEDLRQHEKAANPMKYLLQDYFGVVLDHYSRFKRLPTVKQLNGPTVESAFIAFIHTQEEDQGTYWNDKSLYDRISFSNKYGFGEKTYDPLFPDQWNGPGDPSTIPALNNGRCPTRLGFIDLVKHGLISPPMEDIHEYYRLFEPEVEQKDWITGEVIQRASIVDNEEVRREEAFLKLINKGPYAKKTPKEKITRPTIEPAVQRPITGPIIRPVRVQRENLNMEPIQRAFMDAPIKRVQVEKIERVQVVESPSSIIQRVQM